MAKIMSPEFDGVILTFLTQRNPYNKIIRSKEEYCSLEENNVHQSSTIVRNTR